jgi:hypothetical protein
MPTLPGQNFYFIVEGLVRFFYSTGSLGFAVMKRQFWRQLHCRPPAVQLLA